MIASGFNLSGTYPRINKDPDAKLPYTLDWALWLAGSDLVGATIANSTWAVSDPGLVIESSSTDGVKTQVVLSGGAVGTTYLVTNHIVLDPQAYVDDRSFEVTVVER